MGGFPVDLESITLRELYIPDFDDEVVLIGEIDAVPSVNPDTESESGEDHEIPEAVEYTVKDKRA